MSVNPTAASLKLVAYLAYTQHLPLTSGYNITVGDNSGHCQPCKPSAGGPGEEKNRCVHGQTRQYSLVK